MENSKKPDIKLSKNQNTTQQNQNDNTESITKVHFRLDAPRKSVSFKCNLELWNAFKSEIKRNSLSICHVLEPMIFGWLEGKVHLSRTIKPIKIENLVVERAVKRVRRYAEESVGGEGVVRGSLECCAFCSRKAVFKAFDCEGVLWLCELHFLRVKSRLEGWRKIGR